MRRTSILAAALLVAACAAETQPTPTTSSTPTPTGNPTPTVELTPAPTTPAPTASPTPTPTPTLTATASTAGPFVVQEFADGFAALTFVTHAGDGSGLLYAVEQDGVIRIVTPDGATADEPFLDITERVETGGEQGLLGLAFHPRYTENGRFYVNYTDLNGDTVVAEYLRASPGTADPDSERVLFTVEQPFANHNGGMVAFGPDGALYVGMGDGGSGGDPQGNGQNPKTLLGKMVRVDVDAAGDAAEPTIWDSGLRNPWRFSFDRETDDLWIGDVGQALFEEVNAEPAGQGGRNYGWNIMEGNSCYLEAGCDKTGLTAPVVAYTHDGGACSVTGGYVYRGSAIPALVGTYLYSDYCSGRLYGIDAAAALAGQDFDIQRFGRVDFNVSSFGEDEAGELLIVDHQGQLFRITAP